MLLTSLDELIFKSLDQVLQISSTGRGRYHMRDNYVHDRVKKINKFNIYIYIHTHTQY